MALSSVPLPFYGQFPSGYQPSGQVSSSAAASTSSTPGKTASSAGGNPTDIVDIRGSGVRGGTFTAADSDLFSVSDLYTTTAPAGGSIAGYKVALRSQGSAGNGQLLLGDKDVTGQLSFTADEFSRLHFKAGPGGTQQDLVVVAQTGTRLADGKLSNVVDSPAVQITASVTGTRSINATGALLTRPVGTDANFVNTAQEASIYTGFGKVRPGLASVGNFTAADSDLFSVSDLYTATAPGGGSIAGYKVALRSQGSSGNGQLLLGDKDVTGQLSFTADEFSRLHFKAGPGGTQQDLVVVAQTGTRLADGKLSNVVDSPAVQITASVTGTRSINAVGALLTRATGTDANFVNTAQEASIFTGFGKARPGLGTVGLPDGPQTALNLLAGLLGNFQSTERVPSSSAATASASSTPYQVRPQYLGATGASLSAGAATQSDGGAAPWVLGNSDLGGFQTAGSNLTLQRFAVAAYQASQKT